MRPPHGRRTHEGARPGRPAWPRIIAFRRRHQQKNVLARAAPDEAGVGFTSLYAKAVGQLGSGSAEIRRDGLCALERLAQDNPAQRQAIVNVICAYLRMPFSPTAPAGLPAAEYTGGQKDPGTEDEMGNDEVNGTWRQEIDAWRQERQVRLRAQRILAEHLRDDRVGERRPAYRQDSRFWKDIRLDLTGATLIDFSLMNGVMADADFRRAAFAGDARFGGAAFAGDASFNGAAFGGDASFNGAAFGGAAGFHEAAFAGDALFGGAAFAADASFRKAAFGGDAGFRKAAFDGDAAFDKATFSRDASFGEAVFGGGASFRRVAFGGGAWFDQAAFGRAGFDQAAFTGDAWFSGAAFAGDAGFDQAAFGGDAGFGGAAFGGDAGFGEATFAADAWFDQARFGRGASFCEAGFAGDAWFSEATLSGSIWFSEATFSGGPDALHFDRVRILSPGASHVWPTGWRLADAGRGGYTVARVTGDGSR